MTQLVDGSRPINSILVKTVIFQMDTGADAYVLPLSHAKSLSATVVGSDARLRSHSGDILPSGGKISCWLDKDGVSKLEFELVDADVVYQYLVWRLVWG